VQPNPDDDAPPADISAPTPPDVPPAKGRKRLLPILGLGLLVLLLLGGGIALYVYDKATAPDRSTPIVSADAFLHAALVERSVDQVSLYVCHDWPAEQALAQVSAQPDSSVRVSWGGTSVLQAGAEADVTVRMTFSVAGTGLSQRSVETWRISVVEESDGWRVCSVSRE
jgi:hypothetical protein